MSTLFLYTCPVCVITGAPREQPRPRFIFTFLRGTVAATPTVAQGPPRRIKMKSGRVESREVPLITNSGQV